MNEIRRITPKVHSKVHFLRLRYKYSTGLYMGGIQLSQWDNLSLLQRKKALSKYWYLRWSYRNPDTGKMERRNNIKGSVNFFKTKVERVRELKILQKNLIYFLESGYSPYKQESFDEFFESIENEKQYTVIQALGEALKLKKQMVSPKTFQDYQYEHDKFIKFLYKYKLSDADIKIINKRVITKYLNEVLKSTSARTRNNSRNNLSALFTTLKDNFIIERNFIKTDINKLADSSKKDRTLSNEQLKQISNHLKEHDPTLLLYIKFVSYNFLRPVEVNRLIIKNIDLQEKRIYFKAKNKKNFKTKRIPDLLIEDLVKLELNKYEPDDFLFTNKNNPGPWNATDNNRRDFYTKRFKTKIKDHFKIGQGYGIYSFRHTFITNIFRTYKSRGLSFNQAIDSLMPITGHLSKNGLINYIHSIDADIPNDWSSDIEIVL